MTDRFKAVLTCDLLTWFVRFRLVIDFSNSLVVIYWERTVVLAFLICRVNLDGKLSSVRISILYDIFGWMLIVSVPNYCSFLSSLKQEETNKIRIRTVIC